MNPSHRHEFKMIVERATYVVDLAKSQFEESIRVMLVQNLEAISTEIDKPLTPGALNYIEDVLRTVAAQSEVAGLVATAILLDEASRSVALYMGSFSTVAAVLTQLLRGRCPHPWDELKVALSACAKRQTPRVLAIAAAIAAIVGLIFLLRGAY